MTESPVTRPTDAALDQEVALGVAADRLEEEFHGLADEAAVAGMLHAAYNYLAAGATLDNFLPLLAERYTREFLRAIAEERVQSVPG
ncbi:hypothetical protein AB0H76_14745 [Nocardia sp. NPDC050712]|uniref:three-helix bundle dimerization domain-containing protein n=1 Tax=Nocardia sp. NPDC050712 TaxID=3155518 RepID=UPI0033DD6D48